MGRRKEQGPYKAPACLLRNCWQSTHTNESHLPNAFWLCREQLIYSTHPGQIQSSQPCSSLFPKNSVTKAIPKIIPVLLALRCMSLIARQRIMGTDKCSSTSAIVFCVFSTHSCQMTTEQNSISDNNT